MTQGVFFYILEGGQIVPAGVKIEKHDISKIKVMWNGPKVRKCAQVAGSTEELKKKILSYLKKLQEFNQHLNFGATLCEFIYIRTSMNIKDLAIKLGAMNVIGTNGIGKSYTAEFLSKNFTFN